MSAPDNHDPSLYPTFSTTAEAMRVMALSLPVETGNDLLAAVTIYRNSLEAEEGSLLRTAREIIVKELMPHVAGIPIQDFKRLNDWLVATQDME